MIATVILAVACVALAGTTVIFYTELQTAITTQSGGLVYIGKVSNMSEPENITYGSIIVRYTPPGYLCSTCTLESLSFYTPNSSARLLLVVHYRGFLNTIVLAPLTLAEWNYPLSLTYGFYPYAGVTELDFYILN